ncbi:hypothetical protein [Pantoea phage LIMEzero]|uniref:Exonuclease n=1 Tax=Pantoea phage LIMEzero TaxID=943335 RepID=F4N9S8_9CAUD|nr:hypothetical protein LIMEzero_ORF25 [Pantoea phage LIMEzero]CBY88556.1 hypothetical protein [Pantoea phage LIMEzero]
MGIPAEVAGRVLLTDADSTAYVAAATTKSIETAKTRFVSGVLAAQFLAGSQSSRIYLTASECRKAGRYRLRGQKLYQANRDHKAKPGLVEPLRKAIGRNMFNKPAGEDWYVNLAFDLEADDQIIIDAWATGMQDAVVYSADKDLRCWPGYFLDPYTNRVLDPVTGVGSLWWQHNKSGDVLIGHGTIFFWSQMIMGDTADNVGGLKKGGKKLAYETLAQFDHADLVCESDIAEIVLRMYMKLNQNPWPEAFAMWLYRTETYSFAAHLNTLNLSPELKAWLHVKFKEPWYVDEDWRAGVSGDADECIGETLPVLP